MTDYLLPPFGQINLDALNEEYRSELEFNGKTITLDINFAKTNIEKSAMDTRRTRKEVSLEIIAKYE